MDSTQTVEDASGMLATAVGFQGPSVAVDSEKKTAMMEAARPYHSTDEIRAALADHAGELLGDVAARGYLESDSPSELPIDRLFDSVAAFATAEKGAMALGLYRGGDPTAKIEIRKPLPDRGRLTVVVLPEERRSYAVVAPDGPTPRFASMGRSEVVSTSDDCVACYPEEKTCWVGCGPDSCSCVDIAYPTQCPNSCCYILDNCEGSCSETC